jgi:hypothetical protein
MQRVQKCPKCGLDSAGSEAMVCPACGTPLFVRSSGHIWIPALVQFALAAVFMLVFHFPKFMIAIFGGFCLVGTLAANFLKSRGVWQRNQPQKPVPQSRSYKLVSIGVALCTLAILCILLFGSVMFANEWMRWHEYEGQRFHRSEFQVTRSYYQKTSKSYSAYARGTVEGQVEWMSLYRYLDTVPHSQAEIENLVPAGTTIPIYYFPEMKGRARVQLDEGDPPAEASRRQAFETLHNAGLALAAAIAVLLLFLWMRNACRSNPMSSRDTLQSPITP